MKKIGPVILGFIIGAVLTYLFCPRQIEEMHTLATKIKAPKDTISVKEATRLFKNWQKNNVTEIDSTLEVIGDRKKTTNVEWSLEDVRAYLDYAEVKADSLGYDMTGITVFMGNYGNISERSKKNRNTLFIVPTGKKLVSKASSLNITLQGNGKTGVPPLNNGSGGNGNYP